MMFSSMFIRLAVVTLSAVFFLILVGASVRATGAGMGCPDWPKCFGRWIPPTHVSQLPENYQEIYDVHGHGIEEFNAVKTWTEYINRLIGALTGLLVLATFLMSLGYLRTDVWIPILIFGALFFTGFAAWLGKVVVEMNLAAMSVTLHLGSALAIVAFLVAGLFRTHRDLFRYPRELGAGRMRPLAWSCMGLTLIQFALGAQVRGRVDEISELLGNELRDRWYLELGSWFEYHRLLAFALIVLNCWLACEVYRCARHIAPLAHTAKALALFVLFGAAFGAILYGHGFPAPLQPLHLLLAALLCGAQLYIALGAGELGHAQRRGAETG